MPASLADRWTEEESMALITFYPACKEAFKPLLARHTWRAIRQQAVTLCLTKTKAAPWLPEEITLLKKLRPSRSVEELATLFPSRSKSALFTMAEKYHLHSNYYWPAHELAALNKYFPIRDKEMLLTLIPNRNWQSIVQKARKLGIKGLPPGTIQRQRFKESNKIPEFQSKRLKGLCKKPTKPEQWFMGLVHEYNLPYKYVGDGAILIEGLNPDFINTNGQKIIVEIFGRIWHETLVRDWKRTEEGRLTCFAKYGYRTLILWDDELTDKLAILHRIEAFERGALLACPRARAKLAAIPEADQQKVMAQTKTQ